MVFELFKAVSARREGFELFKKRLNIILIVHSKTKTTEQMSDGQLKFELSFAMIKSIVMEILNLIFRLFL